MDEAIRAPARGGGARAANASYWNSLGMTLGGNGRDGGGGAGLPRGRAASTTKNHRHAYNLGLVLVRQGRAEEARPFFEKALAIDPSFAPAREQARRRSLERAPAK